MQRFFQLYIRIFFVIFAQNIDCVYTLEPYIQLMFQRKIKKNRYTPVNPSFTIHINVRYKRVFFTWTCYPDVKPELKDLHQMMLQRTQSALLATDSLVL